MDDYGTDGGYAGLSNFGGPALGAADAPVVRYQDLHRSHAPASAGAPAVGYGDVMSTPETGVYGDVAIANGPVVEQVPGYGMAATRPLYGGGYGEEPASAATAPAPAAPAPAAPAPAAPAPTTSREHAAKEESGGFLSSVSRGAGQAAKGVIHGLASGAGVSIYQPSDKATKPVSDVKPKEERPEWQTYAIWGGVTVAGVTVAYLLYRSFSNSEKKGGA